MVPGPTIRVTEGDKVRVVVDNKLDESTVVHWHGLMLEHKADGVPFITQEPIKPGQTYTYEFTAASHAESEQGMHGMVTVLIVK